MKGTPSDLLKGFDIPQVQADCQANKFVTLKNVRLLKLSTKDPRGIPGDFEYIKTLSADGEFVKYVPLTTEPVWLRMQRRPDNLKAGTFELKIGEIKISVRLPEYAAKVFRSNTDDGENVVLKAMSKVYQIVNDTDDLVTVWEGMMAMFPQEGRVIEAGEVFEADAYTDFMDDLLGFGAHADVAWKDVSTEYLMKTKYSFTEENRTRAERELIRRERLKKPAGVTK
jgi:hypothetical protein